MSHSLRASVVVPVRNRPELLAKALESLTMQDLPGGQFEVIVCDDGSIEDIAAVVRPFSTGPVAVRLERQAAAGPAAARNLGIRAAGAAIVVFVDSDVTIGRSAIRLLTEALEKETKWQGAEAALHPADGNKGILWDAPASTGGGHYHTAAIAYRRAVLIAIGGFDEDFRLPACEDVELAVRVLAYGPIGFVPDAKAWHPQRKVTLRTHWRWRRHWYYETILAVRYGILAFPNCRAGRFPRLRVAWAAVVALPAGRLLAALKTLPAEPRDAAMAGLYALFDGLCGLSALPSILLAPVPARRDYLDRVAADAPQDLHANNPRTAVVVAAHRMYATLGLCLSGFRTSVSHPADLIFVDNGSGGVLGDWARLKFPDITVLTLDENRLFCGGYNAGIRLAMERGYDSVLIANADTEVTNPGLLADLNDALARQPRAAFVGPLVYYREVGTVQTTCLRFPSLLRNFLVWLPYRLFPYLVSRQPKVESEVEFLNGVCVLCRVAALRETGLMDESFGAYVEDADWGWRARAQGWSSVFTPVPCLIHHEEPHGYEQHSFKSFLLKRNTVWWFVKAGKPWSARGYAVAATALAWIRAATSRTRKERSLLVDFARQLQSVYREILVEKRPGSPLAVDRLSADKFRPGINRDSGAA